MFKWESNLTEEKRIMKNVTNLIGIKKNEVCYDRNMGVTIDYLDKSESKITSEMITEMIDMVNEKEPRAAISLPDLVTIDGNGDYNFKAVVNSV